MKFLRLDWPTSNRLYWGNALRAQTKSPLANTLIRDVNGRLSYRDFTTILISQIFGSESTEPIRLMATP